MNSGNGQDSVDLSKAETLICEKCDNRLFIPAFIIKKISAILSPTGQEVLAPVQVYSCGNCGEVPTLFNKEIS